MENKNTIKAMSKKELAQQLGISSKTLRKWLNLFGDELSTMGVSKNDKLFQPKVAQFIREKLCL